MTETSFPIAWIRSQFPALQRDEIFADNAAGTQLPGLALDSMNEYLIHGYALGGSTYPVSQAADVLSDEIRNEFKEFLGAASENEIHFGLNATTLFRLLSTALSEIMEKDDEIIISNLDHEANITPWLRLQKFGVKVNYWEPRGPERLLVPGDLKALLNDRTRFVMVTGASNVLGTAMDLKSFSEECHKHGAKLIVDAVHMAPHRPIHVRQLGVDILVGSGYKLFGPKLGFMYIHEPLLNTLPSLNHYFLSGVPFETGAPNYEAMAGFRGVFEYLKELADQCGEEKYPATAIRATVEHEKVLTEKMMNGLKEIPSVRLYGIESEENMPWKLPTFALRHDTLLPDKMAEKLAANGIHCRWGHMYAPRLVESLKLKPAEGVCRLSLAHYNTVEEVEQILSVLAEL